MGFAAEGITSILLQFGQFVRTHSLFCGVSHTYGRVMSHTTNEV